jgi:mRNA interferase RelE/StbE
VDSYELSFRPSVQKDLKGVPRRDIEKILARILELRTDPRPVGSVKLSGKEYYRIRQGDYRIVYEIQDAKLIVIVVKVGHRREVYR